MTTNVGDVHEAVDAMLLRMTNLPPRGSQAFADIVSALTRGYVMGRLSTASIRTKMHPETEMLVVTFASALRAKLAAAEQKHGRGDDWRTNDWEVDCRNDLARHVAKGDPLDVAAYAAFCWARGWKTSGSAGQYVVEALRGVADEYMTSEAHHPGYVLIPSAKFEQLRAASDELGNVA